MSNAVIYDDFESWYEAKRKEGLVDFKLAISRRDLSARIVKNEIVRIENWKATNELISAPVYEHSNANNEPSMLISS